MRKYYTRPCNFYYGNYAKKLIKSKKALQLAGNPNIAFDKLEVFYRKKKRIVESNTYSITEVKNLRKELKFTIKSDLKKITAKRKKFVELNLTILKLWEFLM